MAQYNAWETEYKEKTFVTCSPDPQKDILRYLKYMRKEIGVQYEGLKVLDLGSGTGRNANYLASLGSEVVGIELSKTAINLARKRASELGVNVNYLNISFGDRLPFTENSFDLVLDVTSSNSLDDGERKIYLDEIHRVLKPNGNFFVRALSKEGDKNAKYLLKNFPGTDKDTYYIEEIGLYEKVFTPESFIELYSDYFSIIKFIKKSGYATFSGRKYKRNYILAYLENNKS